MVYLISYTWSWTKAAENNGMIALIRPMMAAPCPVARFTNDFLLAIQIWWTLCFVVIQYLAIRSQHIFAHATTAQLSCHRGIADVCFELHFRVTPGQFRSAVVG